jgi:hypothetical protein
MPNKLDQVGSQVIPDFRAFAHLGTPRTDRQTRPRLSTPLESPTLGNIAWIHKQSF